MQDKSIILILLASGVGARLNSLRPKQYLNIYNDRTVIEESICNILQNTRISFILPVINPTHQDFYNDVLSKISDKTRLLDFVYGGLQRSDSVKNALNSLKTMNPDIVLIHDCARPYVPITVVNEVIDNITTGVGVVPVLSVEDALKRINNEDTYKEVNRADLYRIQTPQGFIYNEILSAYNDINQSLLDDSSYYSAKGYGIKIVEGSELSRKITYEKDITILQNMMNKNLKEVRIGIGQDVHQFDNNGKNLILCGVKIPYTRGIKAHSDGDVVLHALVDAILGALSLGDIGDYFPPVLDTWKDKSSTVFLDFCLQKIIEKQGRIVNIDVIILAEEPKISPYKHKMKTFLANYINIDENRINIKATTMEGLGSIGRGEGVFASTVISIEIPKGVQL